MKTIAIVAAFVILAALHVQEARDHRRETLLLKRQLAEQGRMIDGAIEQVDDQAADLAQVETAAQDVRKDCE